ncbi:hypothetical protein COT97_03315 [Candidatus Falkowbacteria bacterium CG10_big_fil_rev_8_21_14_0_10_39_11]|uniref:Uncharacterized protein n=1 Tax=Candidatus Falkowbacteria bacterium CG10_big_fil_rev_8_21_14_0_10_39_11 TaxID=1974565 RepID=A0A2H0V4M4_9BACT|nr:MAG: hypothetical protein COT97_03315 [Candidatus Falkowbacteria bacterium CG10_big_fil_rev_8_21_14_0_10_39_11]
MDATGFLILMFIVTLLVGIFFIICLTEGELLTTHGRISIILLFIFGMPLSLSSIYVEYSNEDTFVIHKEYSKSWLKYQKTDHHRFCYSACANIPNSFDVSGSVVYDGSIYVSYKIKIEPQPTYFDYFVESLPFSVTTPISVDDVREILNEKLIVISTGFYEDIRESRKKLARESEMNYPTPEMQVYVDLSAYFEPRLIKFGWTIKQVDNIEIKGK